MEGTPNQQEIDQVDPVFRDGAPPPESPSKSARPLPETTRNPSTPGLRPAPLVPPGAAVAKILPNSRRFSPNPAKCNCTSIF